MPRLAPTCGSFGAVTDATNHLPEREGRSNGLSSEPPRGGTVLVTGGAGYIGAILSERLLERGYKVRVLDRLYWGEKPLERVREIRDRIRALVAAFVRRHGWEREAER